MGECPLVVVRVVVTLSGIVRGVVVWVVLILGGILTLHSNLQGFKIQSIGLTFKSFLDCS